jgi:hypothetical protein
MTKRELLSNTVFGEKIAELTHALSGVMKLSREIGDDAILQFEEDGNLNKATMLANAIPTNFGRRTAYLAWLKAHAPVVVTHDKDKDIYTLKKDKASTAVPFNTEAALKVAYWDFAPDTSVKLFASSDVDKRIMGVIKSFEDESKNQPMNDKAREHLRELKQVLQQHAA